MSTMPWNCTVAHVIYLYFLVTSLTKGAMGTASELKFMDVFLFKLT